MQKIAVFLVLLLGSLPSLHASPVPAENKDASELLRQGLFEEEANRDSGKAAAAYAGVVQLYDAQHNLAATAAFRLAEIRAKQGDKAEATRLYQRLLTDFADQDALTKLSRERLAALGAPAPPAATSPDAPTDEEGKAMAHILARYPNGTVEPGAFDAVTDEAPYNGRTRMIYAADQGWTRLLTFMLDHGAMVDGWSHSGGPIRAAAGGGHKEAVELLLSRGARIDVADPDGWTALHAACLGHHPQVVSLLLDKGARTEVFCARRPDPKTIPVHAWGPDLPKWLPAWKDIPLGTPLLIAIRNGDVDILTRLLNHHADPNFYAEPGANDKAPLSPLLVALFTGQEATARLLLERGANARFATPEGFTILHAAAAGTPAMAIPLLDLGLKQPADVNGWTPLFYSVYLGGSRHNLNEAKGEERLTPLPEFMNRLPSYEAAWDALLAHGADINAHDHAGLTLVHYNAPDDYHPTEVPGWLVAHGADINVRNSSGQTPLMVFSERHGVNWPDAQQNAEGMKGISWLVEHGADARAEDNNGQTPLTRWSGANGQALKRKYVLPPLLTKFLGTGAVIALADTDRSSFTPWRVEPQADFDRPPSLVLLLEFALAGSFYPHLDIEVHHANTAAGEEAVEHLELNDSSESVTVPKWPVLRWGDVVVFRSDNGAYGDSGRYHELAAGQQRAITLDMGGHVTPLILAAPEADTIAFNHLWAKRYEQEQTTHLKPHIHKPEDDPGQPQRDASSSPIPDSLLAWTPLARPLPGWTLSELILHLTQAEPRARLDAIRLERTVGGQARSWTLDLRAASPAEAETDEEGHPTGVRKVDVWLADGDRLSIPMLPADDPGARAARRQTICLAAPGGLFAQKVFTRPPDDSAAHTLGELFMQAYLSPMVIPNPNLSKIVIHRLTGNAAEEDLPVDLTQTILSAPPAPVEQEKLLQTDLPLQWGDRVEIPTIEGVELAKWKELSPVTTSYLERCLTRQVKVAFNGQLLPGNGSYPELAPEFQAYFADDKMFPVRFTQKGRMDTGTFTALTLLRRLHVNLDTMVRFTLQAGGKTYDYDLKTLQAVNPWIGFNSQVNIQQLSP